jgi:hypothetical protein
LDGSAIPDDPIEGIEPKSESYKLPTPYNEYGELDILCENEVSDIKMKQLKKTILFFI